MSMTYRIENIEQADELFDFHINNIEDTEKKKFFKEVFFSGYTDRAYRLLQRIWW